MRIIAMRLSLLNDYKKRKTFKKQIHRELLPVGWHPSRWWNRCMPKDCKMEIEKLWRDK